VIYDAAGNQTSVSLGGAGTRSFTYDAENRQVTATIPGMSAISYSYDGEGRRVTKIVGGTTTVFVYDAAGRLAAEYGGLANPLTGTTYQTTDHLGSTRLVTDASANVIKRYDYAPFGEEITTGMGGRVAPYPTSADAYPDITPDGVSEKFTSKERDAETGLDFFGARYMSAAQGRFTSPDPVNHPSKSSLDQGSFLKDPERWNLYAYGLNNPLKYTDQNGAEAGAAFPLGGGQMLIPGPNGNTVVQDRMSPREQQVWMGALELSSAVMTGGAAIEVAIASQGAFAAVTGGIAAAGLGVNGSTRLIGTAMGQSQETIEKGTTAVSAVTTPVGLAVTLATGGRVQVGAVASGISSAVSAARKPGEAAKDAGGTALTVGNLIQDIKSFFKSPPPPSPPPPPPPPKTCDGSNTKCH